MVKMEHILKGSEPDYRWFSKDVRNFLNRNGVLPKKPKEGKEKFPIYDSDGNKYIAEFDHQGRLFCRDWYDQFMPEEGDKIMVRIENGERIIIYPAEKETNGKQSLDESEKEKDHKTSEKGSESPLINIKVEINFK